MKGYSIFPKAPHTGAAPSDCFVSYPGHLLVGGLPLCRDAIDKFCSPIFASTLIFDELSQCEKLWIDFSE